MFFHFFNILSNCYETLDDKYQLHQMYLPRDMTKVLSVCQKYCICLHNVTMYFETISVYYKTSHCYNISTQIRYKIRQQLMRFNHFTPKLSILILILRHHFVQLLHCKLSRFILFYVIV